MVPTHNDRGWPVGENHPRARISNDTVHEIRYLHEVRGLAYKEIVALFADRGLRLRYRYVKKICNYETRTQAGELAPRDD